MQRNNTMLTEEKLWNSNYLKVFATNFMIFFSFMLLTPLLPSYLSDTFGAYKQTIGFVLSGYTLTTLFIRALSGYIVDSFPRRIVLIISYAFFSLFFAGYLLADTLLFFAVVRTLHGVPFGAATVSNSTVAIDVLPSSRRVEGIGYYGLSNNIATAVSPTIALLLFDAYHNYDLLFWVAFVCAFIGLINTLTVKLPNREIIKNKQPLSLDRFILLKGWRQGVALICFAFSYGVVSTYIAIYGKDELGITGGTGLFFMLLSTGLILSRLTGGRTLRQGKVTQNATVGTVISFVGYFIFAAFHNYWGYYGAALIIGLGNGHMFPAFQTMFVNLVPNSQRGTANSTLLVSWDIGIGLGILMGGIISEYTGYYLAFWTACGINALGVSIFYLFARNHFLKNKLR